MCCLLSKDFHKFKKCKKEIPDTPESESSLNLIRTVNVVAMTFQFRSAWSDPIQSYPARSDPIRPDLIQYGPIRSNTARSDPRYFSWLELNFLRRRRTLHHSLHQPNRRSNWRGRNPNRRKPNCKKSEN